MGMKTQAFSILDSTRFGDEQFKIAIQGDLVKYYS